MVSCKSIKDIYLIYIWLIKLSFSSRNPVSSDAEAIYIKENTPWHAMSYKKALRALGFREYNGSFRPCPLGTFTNGSTKGVDGCLNCPPGNFSLPL